MPIVQDDDDPSPLVTRRAGGQIGRAGRGHPSRSYRWEMVLPFGAASVLLLFVFVGGVDFLRARLLGETEKAGETSMEKVEIPQPKPSSPAPASTPSPPVLDLGQAVPVSPVTVWPALLRVNRYTVGSPAYRQAGGLIPEFPPTQQLPVHVVRETRENLHSGAPPGRPPVRRQPETGPAMWVLGVMSLGMLPLFLKRRVSQ